MAGQKLARAGLLDSRYKGCVGTGFEPEVSQCSYLYSALRPGGQTAHYRGVRFSVKGFAGRLELYVRNHGRP